MSWLKDLNKKAIVTTHGGDEDLTRKIIDPGNLGVSDALLGKKKGPDTAAEQAQMDAALEEFYRANADYIRQGPSEYSWLNDLENPEALGDTGLAGIETDPRYSRYEDGALRDLEQLSKDGLSMRDQADMAKLENDVNRQNSGRLGAIRQNMQARGMSGSGMDLVAQQQAAQDATERQALASMEKAAQTQEGRRDATSRLGSMAGQMQSRDWNQQAAAASAQDRINEFNTRGRNGAAMYNHQGRQGTANDNVGVQNTNRNGVLNSRQNVATTKHNAAADKANKSRMQFQQDQAYDNAQSGRVLSTAGTVVGAFGGPAGAAAGAKAGQAISKDPNETLYASHGGRVPGQAHVPGDSPANDTQPAQLSPGEIVIPRSIANDPNAAKKFVEQTNEQDAVSGLLKALEHMTKKKKG